MQMGEGEGEHNTGVKKNVFISSTTSKGHFYQLGAAEVPAH